MRSRDSSNNWLRECKRHVLTGAVRAPGRGSFGSGQRDRVSPAANRRAERKYGVPGQRKVAQREGVISEHKNAIEALRKEIAAQGASIAFLQEELTLRDRLLLDREAGIGFLRYRKSLRGTWPPRRTSRASSFCGRR